MHCYNLFSKLYNFTNLVRLIWSHFTSKLNNIRFLLLSDSEIVEIMYGLITSTFSKVVSNKLKMQEGLEQFKIRVTNFVFVGH